MKEAWSFIRKFVLDPPKSLHAAIWRGVALWMVTTAVAVAWIATQNPSVFQLIQDDRELHELVDINEGSTDIRELIDDFVQRHEPSRLALVARVSNVGVRLVWSNLDADSWPTSVDGVMSPTMKPILGYLAFDGCWSGQIQGSNDNWIFCAISDSGKNYGYLVTSWPPNSKHSGADCKAELKALAQRIGEILF